MQGRLRIAIVGYGTAGQAAAIMLRAQGHTLTVFEQAPALRPVGAGFLLQPTGFGVLFRMGLHEAVLEHGQRIERLHGCNHRHRTVMDMRYADHAPDCFGMGMTRGSLFTVLRDAYPDAVLIGVCIEQVTDDGRCLLDDKGESYGPFDLIVVANGAHSRLRRFAPGLLRHETVYPWGALWCLLPGDDWPYPRELRQRYVGSREMIGMLPVGRRMDHPGRWMTFYFSLPGNRVDAFDERGFERMRGRVAAIWPEVSALLKGVDSAQQLNRARYRDVVMRAPVHGRMVFLGDAAHAMSPQLGQGVNMALLDAEALAGALEASTGVDEALQSYAGRRRAHLAVYQRLSRWLTPLFQSDRKAWAVLRDLGFGPLGRMPLVRGQMLKILAGTKVAWWR